MREGIKCRRAILWPPQLTENASRLGYKHVCVNYLHVASHDYQEVIQHTDTHIHTLTKSFNFFLTQLPPLFQHAGIQAENESCKYYWIKNISHKHIISRQKKGLEGTKVWKANIADLVPKGAHARGYALQLKIKHCWKLFLFEMLCCVLAWMNEYIVQLISATRLWLISRYNHHTLKKRRKNDRQKRTSMYRVSFVTLLTNKPQALGETITDLYAENIVLYG